MRTRILQPETSPLAERLLHPFQELVHAETSSGILLLVCTVIALLNEAKVGILLAFLVSGLGGFLLLRRLGSSRQTGVRSLESGANI